MAEGKIKLSSLVPWHEGCYGFGCLKAEIGCSVWSVSTGANISSSCSFTHLKLLSRDIHFA